MADNKQVIIDIKVNSQEAYDNAVKAQQALNNLRAEQQALNSAYKAGEVSSQDYAKAQVELNQKVSEQKEILRANTKEIETNEGSLVQLRNQLKTLTKEYDNLSKAEREGARGTELQNKISVLTSEITRAEESTGRFQRNVGNYKGKISEAFTAMGGSAGKMINPIKGATEGLKMMSKTPVIAVLGILVNIIGKVISSLKNNEEQMNRVKTAMSAFSGVAKIVQGVVDTLARFIGNLAEKLGNLLAKLTRTKAELKEEQALTKAEIELQKQERQQQVEIARNNQKISEYRLKANQRDKYSASERKKMIEEAERLETKNFELEKNLAYKRYEIIKRRNAQTASGTKDINAENEAYVRYLETATAYNNRMRELSEKNASLTAEIKSNTKAVDDNKTSLQEQAKEQEEEEQRLIAMANLAIKNEADLKKYNGQLREYLELNIAWAENVYDTMKRLADESDEEFLARQIQAMNQLKDARQALADFDAKLIEEQNQREADLERQREERWRDAKDYIEAQQQAYISLYMSIAQALGTLGGIMGEFAEKNKAFAIADAGLKLAQIYTEQALAIARGVSSAMYEAFPFNLIAVGSVVTAVTSTIASTISTLKSARQSMQKYAEGGLVQGPGTGTSDSINARLSNGEFVVNAEGTRKHLAELVAFNGGWGNTSNVPHFARGGAVGLSDLSSMMDATALKQAMREAVEGFQPVVSVKEITRVSNRVKVKEQIANA